MKADEFDEYLLTYERAHYTRGEFFTRVATLVNERNAKELFLRLPQKLQSDFRSWILYEQSEECESIGAEGALVITVEQLRWLKKMALALPAQD